MRFSPALPGFVRGLQRQDTSAHGKNVVLFPHAARVQPMQRGQEVVNSGVPGEPEWRSLSRNLLGEHAARIEDEPGTEYIVWETDETPSEGSNAPLLLAGIEVMSVTPVKFEATASGVARYPRAKE